MKKTYAYDPLMRIQTIEAKLPGQNAIMRYDYTYDKKGNILTKQTEHGTYAYGYDDLYRLTSSDNPGNNDEAFTYDDVGNRMTSADTTGNWNYNKNNELLSYNGTNFDYDDNGNTIQKTENGQVTRYIYNTENRMIKVEMYL